MNFNNTQKGQRSTLLDSSQQRHSQQPIVVQKPRQGLPSLQQQQGTPFKPSFGNGLPSFLPFAEKRSPVKRSSSVHTLNVNSGNPIEDDVPPLKSQDDTNFDILANEEPQSTIKQYHNYNSFSTATGNNTNEPVKVNNKMINGLTSNKNRNIFTKTGGNSISPFNRFKPTSSLLLSPQTPNSSLSVVKKSTMAKDLLKKQMKQFQEENEIIQDEIQRSDVDSADVVKKSLSNILRFCLILVVFIFQLILKLKNLIFKHKTEVDDDPVQQPQHQWGIQGKQEKEEARNQQMQKQKPPEKRQPLLATLSSTSSDMDIDTLENSINSMPTPLTRNSVWQIENDIFNVSSLNWGEKHNPTLSRPMSNDDYGTHFITEKEKQDDEQEPNFELEYIRKIFNNDGKFELPLYDNELREQQQIKPVRQSSISKMFNLTETFRSALGGTGVGSDDENKNDDEVLIVEERASIRPGVSRFDISRFDKLNDESLLLFEEEFKTYQSIIEEKRRRQDLIKDLKTRNESKVKRLDSNQLLVVLNYLNSSDINLVVKKNLNGIEIRVKDLKTLENSRWLNDNIIDCYLNLVTKRSQLGEMKSSSFSFTTHFYSTLASKGYKSVQRWAKRQKVDVTQLDYIFIPINSMNTHWSLLVINNKQHKFQYFDSLSFDPDEEDRDGDKQERFEFYQRRNSKILQNLVTYMQEEDKRLHNGTQTIDFENDYQLVPVIKSPQQKNGSDCGVFTCTTVEFLSRDKFLNFSQSDMPNLRLKMCFEILNENLL